MISQHDREIRAEATAALLSGEGIPADTKLELLRIANSEHHNLIDKLVEVVVSHKTLISDLIGVVEKLMSRLDELTTRVYDIEVEFTLTLDAMNERLVALEQGTRT